MNPEYDRLYDAMKNLVIELHRDDTGPIGGAVAECEKLLTEKDRKIIEKIAVRYRSSYR